MVYLEMGVYGFDPVNSYTNVWDQVTTIIDPPSYQQHSYKYIKCASCCIENALYYRDTDLYDIIRKETKNYHDLVLSDSRARQ